MNIDLLSISYTIINNQLVKSSSSKAVYLSFQLHAGRTPLIKAALSWYSDDFYAYLFFRREPKIEQ